MSKQKELELEGGLPDTPLPLVEKVILSIRGERVILDRDLATIYSVPTKVFNQA